MNLKLLLLLAALGGNQASGQPSAWNLALDLSAGFGIGWWQYDRGATSAGAHLYDRSHTSLFVPLQWSVWAHHRSGPVIGIVGGYSYFHDYLMRRHNYQTVIAGTYRISQGNGLHFWRMGMVAGFHYRSGPIYVQPEVRGGFFRLRSIHPERHRFALHRWHAVYLKLGIQGAKARYYLAPCYRQAVIHVRHAASGEQHHIRNTGIAVGTEIPL